MSSVQEMVFNASKDGEVDQIKDLLKNLSRYDRNVVLGPTTHPNGETTTPLIMAALYSQNEVIDVLIQDYGVNVEQTGMIEYDGQHLHSKSGNKHYVSHLAYTYRRRYRGFLTEEGEDAQSLEDSDVCANGVTALWVASLKGYSSIVRQLVEKYGADVNHAAVDGSTPLRMACVCGYSTIASFLLEHGAEVNATMKDNSTALMIAALYRNRHEVKMLVKNGAEVNQKTVPQGRTALHYAAQGGDYIIVINLMRNGAEFCEDLQGFTPIHIACMVKDSDILEYLLSNFIASTKERIEAIELLGAAYITADPSDEDILKCWQQWEAAMEERYEDMENIIHKRMLSERSAIYTNEQEVQSMEELIAIKDNKEAIIFEAIMAQERILGENTMLHSEEIATFLSERGNEYANNESYEKCVAFWLKSIAIRKQADKCVSEDIMKFAELFEDLEEHGVRIDVKILFQVLSLCIEDIQNENYRVRHSESYSKIIKSQENVDQSIYFMLFLIQKLRKHIKDNDAQTAELTKYVVRFNNLKITTSKGNTLLHVCCDDDNENPYPDRVRIKNAYVRHALTFPNLQLVEFLLESGTDISAINYNDETVLHTLAQCDDFEDTRQCETQSEIQKICRLLIDYGVHIDRRKECGFGPTAQDCANLTVAYYLKQNRADIPLKCLAAQILKPDIHIYRSLSLLPKSLLDFVQCH